MDLARSDLPLVLDPDLLQAHQMFFCGMAAMLTLLHLALFAFQPRLRENLFCALFTASYGLVIYVNLEAALVPVAAGERGLARLFLVGVAIATLTWLVTLNALLRIAHRRIITAFAVAAAVLGVWGLAAPGTGLHLAVFGLVTAAGATVAWWIVEAWRARVPGVGLIGSGMALLAGAVIYSVLRTLGFVAGGEIGIYLPAYGGVCAAISLSLLVARNFASVSRDLEQKLVEVETLSRKALAHEQEKQRLIAAKNAELEGLVTVRTAELQREKGKSDELLYNILPREAADELKATGRATPRRYEDVTILFTDFKGFTNTVAAMPADKLVTELNDIFNRFDDIIDRHGLQKIKTIGDAYMVAGGLAPNDPGSAARVVDAALDFVACIAERNQRSAVKWHMRLGMHTGVVVAGVVGKRRLIYDLFGDAVNIASRMESHGEPGRVNLSAYTYDLVRERHPCDYLGKIDVKGKGEIDMYCVTPRSV